MAKERHLPLKVIVSENGVYGSILIHQERHYPGRNAGTRFANPNLMLMGKAYGFETVRISQVAQFPLLTAALNAPGTQFVGVDTSFRAVLPKPGS